MHASVSFQQIETSSSSTIAALSALHSTISGLVQWISGDRPWRCMPCKKPQIKHFYWILISLNIFIALAYCDDDLIAPSTQPFPQKRSGGKFNSEFWIFFAVFFCLSLSLSFFACPSRISIILHLTFRLYLQLRALPLLVYWMWKTIVIKPSKFMRMFHRPTSPT